MKRLGLLLILLLSLAALAFFYFGTSMIVQKDEAVLLFSRANNENEVTSLYTLNAATGEESLILESENFHRADWVGDGRIWVVDHVDSQRDAGRFRFLDTKTGKKSLLSENMILNSDQCYPALLWSPNRQSLAYFTRTKDKRILNIQEGTDTRQFAMPFAEDEYLSHWADDGASILIYSGSQKERLLAVDDGSEMLVAERIQYSPDNRFVSYVENEMLWLYELATGERRNLEVAGSIGAWLPGVIFINDGHAKTWTYNLETRKLSPTEIGGVTQATFINQRYRLLGNDYSASEMYLYDTQQDSLMPLDLGYKLRFADLSEDKNEVFLYADFKENQAHKLISYILKTGETKSLFETSGSIYSVMAVGDWLFIHYSALGGDDDNPIFFLRNRKTSVEMQEGMDYDIYGQYWRVSLSPDKHWVGLNADDGVYFYDLRSNSRELERLVPPSNVSSSVSMSWSSDSRYMSLNAEGQAWLLNAESREMTVLPDSIKLIGWNNAKQNYVLLCNPSADGLG